MKNIFVTLILTLLPIAAMPQAVIYTNADSIRIEEILHRLDHRTGEATGERIIAIANEFIGEKYVTGTLEQGIEEPLFVSCTELDCTTFVELVLAIAKTADENSCKFTDVCRNLETIRYRYGKNNGYTSRLHYISWWITDSAKAEILEEMTPQISNARQSLFLNFMSTHPDSYPLLTENPQFVKDIEALEIPYREVEVNYIPKEKLKREGCKNIKPGDIIAITTSIPGLDVTHVGFAYYHEGTLCLLHASSGKGEVVKDRYPLYEYLAKNKRHTGIRVFRSRF